MASVPGAKTPATWRVACALFAGVAALAGTESAHADTYAVLIRQMDGVASVPAHMICAENKVCHGVMSISAAGGHMRVFVIAMIDGGNAYFRFHAEERDFSCGRPRDFVAFALGRPPLSDHGYALLCDARPSSRDAPQGLIAEPPVLKNITPPLATLRIDLRSIEKDGGR